MVGIILITHGSFSNEILRSAELVVGPCDEIKCITLQREENVEDKNELFKKYLEEVDKGDVVLVLVDLLGGSPCNIASLNIRNFNYKTLTGLNFPMLLEAINSREEVDLEELTKLCYEAGREGIKNINELLK